MTRKFIFTLIISLSVFHSSISKGDLFGADVAVLTQILAEAIAQYAELSKILGTGSDTLGLLQDINRGINDSLNLLHSINPNLDPGLYRNWTSLSIATSQIQAIYGGAVNSPEIQIQQDADQSVAEAVSFNNDFYKWSANLDALGESIKGYSHQVSPGGAEKLSAQSLGIIIQVLNQNLRAQATSLKLQAQQMAISNHLAKESTKETLNSSDSLNNAMKMETTDYAIPQF